MLERLELINFGGYRRAEVEFSQGLNIITGRNSTGKTTILEAVLYALYGEAPGIEKRGLVSRLQGLVGAMSVRLRANLSGRRVEVLRAGRLTKDRGGEGFRTERLMLLVDGREVQIEGEGDLNRRVGMLMEMGVRKFLSLAYVRQGELTSILEPRREDMDLILGVSLMREIAEQLDSARRTLEIHEGRDVRTQIEMYREQLPGIEEQIRLLEGQLPSLMEEVKRLEEAVSKAKSEELRGLLKLVDERDAASERLRENRFALSSLLRDRGVQDAAALGRLAAEVAGEADRVREEAGELKAEEGMWEGALDEASGRLSRVDAYLRAANASSLEELEGRIRAGEGLYSGIERELKEAERGLEAFDRRRSELEGRVSALRGEVLSHEDLLSKGAVSCPTCGQDVRPELLTELIEGKKATLAGLVKELGVVSGERGAWRARVDELRRAAARAEAELGRLRESREKVAELLEGATREALERRREEARRRLDDVRGLLMQRSQQLAGLERDRRDLEAATAKARVLLGEGARLEAELAWRLESIEAHLRALSLPFKPDDPELKAKIAGRLPLSVEELARMEGELNHKRRILSRLSDELAKSMEARERAVGRVRYLERRLERAELCARLLERLKAGVEGYRRRRLRRIESEAQRVYNMLTDQRVYKAFRIDDESYRVSVYREGVEGYIPAKRVGGGHQTLIALAVRLALLNVLGMRGMLMLDEPTYGVDSENLPQLMAYFAEAAKRLRQMVLVTHHGLGEEEAANIVKVSLAADGSSTLTYSLR